MADTIVDIPGVGRVSFPDSMSGDEINAAAKRLHDEAQPTTERSSAATLPVAGLTAGAALPAIVDAGRRVAEQIATSPIPAQFAKNPTAAKIGAQATKAINGIARRARGVSPIIVLTDLARGDMAGAAKTAAIGAAAEYGPKAINAAVRLAPRTIQSTAARIATTLPSNPAAAGAGAGLALPMAFLGALQRDANRQPNIDPEADTPASTILRGFLTMAGKRR